MVTFVLIFACYDSGELMTNQFEIFDKQLCECNWYLFSIEMQRILVIFITITKQPTIIRCYGNIEITRETFKKVSIHFKLFARIRLFIFNIFQTYQTGFSYFMTIRQFGV